MSDISGAIPEEKARLHGRNKHKFRYNFPELIASCAELTEYVSLNPFGNLSIDFKNPEGVKTLNKALLVHFYDIKHWQIPEGYLCPPIPGRADYIHYAADLLAEDNMGIIPTGKQINVLDIGVGANCIYPLIGNKEYGWKFTGTDIDDVAINSAQSIASKNSLQDVLSFRKQSKGNIFSGIIKDTDFFNLTICNPPFHSSLEEATSGTKRKWKNLGEKAGDRKILNFGGRNNELWCKGGEQEFVTTMIKESGQFSKKCLWFTSLISKKETLKSCYKTLEKASCSEYKTINMAQGQKVSRILAWTFFDKNERSALLNTRTTSANKL